MLYTESIAIYKIQITNLKIMTHSFALTATPQRWSPILPLTLNQFLTCPWGRGTQLLLTLWARYALGGCAGAVLCCVCVHVYVCYDMQELSYFCRVLSLSLNWSNLWLNSFKALLIYLFFLFKCVLCADCHHHLNPPFFIPFFFIPFSFILPFPPTVVDLWVWALRSAWTRQQ